KLETLGDKERKGLLWAGISFVVTCALLSLLVLPEWGPLRGEGTLLESPFFKNLVPVILIMFLVPGIVYGYIAQTIKNTTDIAKQLTETMVSMAPYIVLSFVAAQFVAYFTKSNMGLVLAVKGAEVLEASGLKGIALIIGFILVSSVINLFIGSSSAKWAIMAPIFVPIMMQFGYSPELTQLAYRIADSSTNIISPLMVYFAIVIAFAQKYDKNAGIGTLVTTMLPYSIAFLLGWIVMLLIWMGFDLPLGPGTSMFYGG
ncbi:MAG: AbgT family transporter, partial [Bacilli bacterium]